MIPFPVLPKCPVLIQQSRFPKNICINHPHPRLTSPALSPLTRYLSTLLLSVRSPALSPLARYLFAHLLSVCLPRMLSSPIICPLTRSLFTHPLYVRSPHMLSLLTRCLSGCHTHCPCSPIVRQLACSLSPHPLSVHSLTLCPLTRFLSAPCVPCPLTRSARLLTHPHACSSARVPATRLLSLLNGPLAATSSLIGFHYNNPVFEISQLGCVMGDPEFGGLRCSRSGDRGNE